MKREFAGTRSAWITGAVSVAGIRAGAATLFSMGLALGQTATPAATGNSNPGELGVPSYVNSGGVAPTSTGVAKVNTPTPGAGVANDFRSLQNVGNSGVPYLGGAGGAGAQLGNGGGRLLNWDRGSIGLGVSLRFSYVDNAVQQIGGGNGEDFVFNPMLNLTGTQAISENANLTLSVGVGYSYSANYRDLTQISLMPLGSINYSITVGDVLITFFDRISSPANNRPEIAAGGQAAGVDFNRFENQLGVSSAWSITEDTTVSGMYGFTLDRSLSDAYQILNRNIHSISGGIFNRPSPYWSVGLTSQAAYTSFSQRFQNNSTTFGIGPVISFRPTETITLTAGVQYTVMSFGTSGQISDRTEFNGLTWQGSINQILTESITHSIHFASGVDSGLGSNYTETMRVGYQVAWRLLSQLGLTAHFDYQKIKQSSAVNGFAIVTVDTGTFIVPVSFIANDRASFYQAGVNGAYQLTERTSANLGYNYTRRDSRFGSRSFSVNTVSLALNYQF